jgi:hypothetical protein
MDQRGFDAFARALGTARSRRQVLRAMAALAASGLAAGRLGEASAAPGGNDDCAHFCHAVFPDEQRVGQCTADAARGQGVCYQCGPAAPAGHPVLCGTACCQPGQVCAGGACVTACVPSTCADLNATCGVAPDGCGDTLDCGICASNERCVDNACQPVCVPDCTNTQCGSDGCGGSCGTCASLSNASAVCTSGTCIYTCDSGFQDCDAGGGCECAGTGCCGSSCQTAHSNGVGQSFYDCTPLNTYNATQATEACNAYVNVYGGSCGPGLVCGSGFVVCTTNVLPAHCWQYTGAAAGHVSTGTTQLCPLTSDPFWS